MDTTGAELLPNDDTLTDIVSSPDESQREGSKLTNFGAPTGSSFQAESLSDISRPNPVNAMIQEESIPSLSNIISSSERTDESNNSSKHEFSSISSPENQGSTTGPSEQFGPPPGIGASEPFAPPPRFDGSTTGPSEQFGPPPGIGASEPFGPPPGFEGSTTGPSDMYGPPGYDSAPGSSGTGPTRLGTVMVSETGRGSMGLTLDQQQLLAGLILDDCEKMKQDGEGKVVSLIATAASLPGQADIFIEQATDYIRGMYKTSKDLEGLSNSLVNGDPLKAASQQCSSQLKAKADDLMRQVENTKRSVEGEPETECKCLGRPDPTGVIRIYTQEECTKLGGNFAGNGECLRPEGGSFSWDCRFENTNTQCSKGGQAGGGKGRRRSRKGRRDRTRKQKQRQTKRK